MTEQLAIINWKYTDAAKDFAKIYEESSEEEVLL